VSEILLYLQRLAKNALSISNFCLHKLL